LLKGALWAGPICSSPYIAAPWARRSSHQAVRTTDRQQTVNGLTMSLTTFDGKAGEQAHLPPS
jgi:hypothetical protein